MIRPGRRTARLKAELDRLYDSFNHPDSAVDPIDVVRRYADPADREIAAFCASALAFGRVAGILQSIEAILAPMGTSPRRFVERFDPRADRAPFDPLVHRWTRGPDFVALLWILHGMIGEAGSIEAFFSAGYDPEAPDVGPALDRFSARALGIDLRPAYGRTVERPGAAFFFPRPSAGSACKRLNLFLRWMVRRDRIDFGIWSRVRRASLVVPLDVHVVRVGRCLGLTRYRSPGWRMAADLTASLRLLDPIDPVRYDFSLCHLGMTAACGFNRPAGDRACPLRGLCRPAAHRPTPRDARRRPGSRAPYGPR